MNTKRIGQLLRSEQGVTAIEYALIAALIAVAIIAATSSLGGKVSSTFGTISAQMP